MGFFSGTRLKEPTKYINDLLLKNERVNCTYKYKRNLISLTSKRLIIVKKSLLAREVSICSIPYEKIDNIKIDKNRKLFSLSSLIKIKNNKQDHTFKVGKGEGGMKLYNLLVFQICHQGKNEVYERKQLRKTKSNRK